jgi:hypothetical protein
VGEIAFERNAVQWAQEHGWLVRKMRYIERNGCPDRWFFKDGVIVPIEFKSSTGRLSLVQEREHARLAAHGCPVLIVRTQEELEAALAP